MKVRSVIRLALPAILVVVFLAAMASSAFAVAPLNLTITAHTYKNFSFDVPASCYASPSVDTTAVKNWVKNTVAKAVYRKMLNEDLDLNFKDIKKYKKLKYQAKQDGYQMYEGLNGQQDQLCSLIASAIPSAVVATDPVSFDFTGLIYKRKAKSNSWGKQILVVQSQRKIYLYKDHTIIKTYRCAVGMHAYPTPNGTFHIGKKNPAPTWTNGYAPWSMGMPAFIGPGPNNPLGTRAMYVFSGKGPKGGSDTGVRFHGVPPSENSSIGTAASHGCLRMHRKDVEAFYPLVPLGTRVYIVP